MTVKNAWVAMVVLVLVAAALAALLFNSMGLNLWLVAGLPPLAAAVAIGVIVRLKITALNDEEKMAGQWARVAADLAETKAALVSAIETHKKQQAQSAAAAAALEAELDEIGALMDKLCEGDFVAVGRNRLRSPRGQAAANLAGNLREICGDIGGVAAALIAGDLKRTTDPDRHKGEWNKLALDINRGMAHLGPPIAQARSVCEGFAQGLLNGKVDAEARGDLQQLKNAANNAAAGLSKYVGNIGSILAEGGTRGRSFHEMPGDFAYLKSAISDLNEQVTAKNTVAVHDGRRRAADKDDSNTRFSGAPKVNDMARTAGFDFNRKDFGKY